MMKQLFETFVVKMLTVTDYDEARPLEKFQMSYVVDGIKRYNQTCMTFYTTAGDKIHISRATVRIEKANGVVHATCAGNVKCAPTKDRI